MTWTFVGHGSPRPTLLAKWEQRASGDQQPNYWWVGLVKNWISRGKQMFNHTLDSQFRLGAELLWMALFLWRAYCYQLASGSSKTYQKSQFCEVASLLDKETSILITQMDSQISKQFESGTRTLDAPTKTLFKPGLQAIQSKPLEVDLQAIQSKPIQVEQKWLLRVCAARQNTALGHSESYRSEEGQSMARWWLGTQG
jgi:hypothetical protein